MGLLERSRSRTDGTDLSEGRARMIALAGLALFLLITALVEAQALHGADMAVMLAKNASNSGPLYVWSQAVGLLLSAEFSIVYTAVAFLAMLAHGLRRWALAPGAWLFGTAVEVIFKLLIHQPAIPREFIITSNYPLTSVTMPGSFPSGHAIRTGFLFAFLAVLLWNGGGLVRRVMAALLMAVAVIACYARVYMGQHWTSDVVAGGILGVAIALLVAPRVEWLIRQRGRTEARPR